MDLLFWTSSNDIKLFNFLIEVEAIYLLLFPMKNVTDNRCIPSMYFHNVAGVTKLFCQREKELLSFDFLKSCWWLLIHSHITTLCFMPPIYFQNSVSMPLFFHFPFKVRCCEKLRSCNFKVAALKIYPPQKVSCQVSDI